MSDTFLLQYYRRLPTLLECPEQGGLYCHEPFAIAMSSFLLGGCAVCCAIMPIMASASEGWVGYTILHGTDY